MEFKINKNPDVSAFAEISEAVAANEGYCPCLLDKNENTKCMCKDFRESDEVGFCHCGRYYKTRKYESLAVIGDISDFDSLHNYTTWCEKLAYQDFIVYGIPVNLYSFEVTTKKYLNLCKTIIANADAVLVLDCSEETGGIVADFIYWAEELGKKVLTSEDLKQ